jgi:glutamate racemase
MTKIGVFDSGIGGLSVKYAIERAMPELEILFRSDREHMPYGDKTPEQILGYVVPILQDLVGQGCEAIVIACNTVTTALITTLREQISISLIGIEPMIKQAAEQTQTNHIAVCATPVTLGSDRYAWLKSTYAKDMQVIEPDCSRWAYMIEHDEINESLLRKQINEVCEQGADVIVLGCTHYHWIESLIKRLADGRATILQPEALVVAELQRTLAETISAS